MKNNNIVWPAIIAATLSGASLLAEINGSNLTIPLGLAAITSAILSLRA